MSTRVLRSRRVRSPSSSTTATFCPICAGTRARCRPRAAARPHIPQVRQMDRLNQLGSGAAHGPPRRPIRCGLAPGAGTARCTAITVTSRGCAVHRARHRGPRARRTPRWSATASGSAPRASAQRAARRAGSSPTCARRRARYWPGCDAIDKGAPDIAAALRCSSGSGRAVCGSSRRRRRARAIRCSPPATAICSAGTPAGSRRRCAGSQGRDQLLGVSVRAAARRPGEGINLRTEVVSLRRICSRPPPPTWRAR